MSILHNLISKKVLKKRMFLDKEPRFTVSFYKYCIIANPKEYRNEIYNNFYKYNVFGRVYIAHEGINAQISVPKKFYYFIKDFLYKFDAQLKTLYFNKSLNNNKHSFWVLCVKVKRKIVEDGIKNPLFNPHHVGTYIKSKQVNLMLNDNQTIFIDMRNSYEYAIGHFEKSLEIKSITFREQLKIVVELMQDFKNKKIVMYCTGGIRCEKATAWMRFNNFKNIYHLKGGIIGYVNNAKKNKLPVLFKGKIFVFDNRISEKVSDDVISFCKQCNQPSDTYVNCSYNLCHLLFIQCQKCAAIFNNFCSEKCIKENNFIHKN